MSEVAKSPYTQELERIAQETRRNRVIRFFPNSDMRCSHDGLGAIAKKHKIEARNLGAGEFLVFANRLQNRFKIYAPGNVLVYLKSPDNKRLEMRVVQLIPRFFNGTEFDYNKALKEFVVEKLERKRA